MKWMRRGVLDPPLSRGMTAVGWASSIPVIARRAEAIQPSPVAASTKAMRLRTMLCVALRRMAPDDDRACRHPSRRKPSPCGRRLAPQDEVREPGDDAFHRIDPLAHSSCRLWTSKRRMTPSAFALRATADNSAPIRPWAGILLPPFTVTDSLGYIRPPYRGRNS
jgi:hypothetical protein